MKVSVHGITDVGRKRDKNEDSILVDPDLGIFMVADGMGGHLGGEFASQMAVKTVREVLVKSRESNGAIPPNSFEVEGHPAGQPPTRYAPKSPGDLLKLAIGLASRRIFRDASRIPGLRGMGTTTVAILVRNDQAFVAHVGDSRAYLVRSGEIRQLTIDHSLVVEQLQAGFITEAEVRNHKFRNIITRSVGFQEDVEVDLSVVEMEEDDRFILCSDGLTNLVSEAEILKQVLRNRQPNPKAVCERLVNLANERGGDDNCSVVFLLLSS